MSYRDPAECRYRALELVDRVVFSLDPLVDSWSGLVAQAAVPEPAGVLSIWFLDPKTGTFKTTPPHDVKFGEEIGFYAFGENTSGRTQRMRIVVRLYDPDGVLIDSGEREMDIDYPGTLSSPTLEGIVAKSGNYTGEAELYAE